MFFDSGSVGSRDRTQILKYPLSIKEQRADRRLKGTSAFPAE